MWSCSCSQAMLSSASRLCLQSAKRRTPPFQMTSRDRCGLMILFWRFRSNFWKPVFVVGKLLRFGSHVSPSSLDSSPISSIISSAAGGWMTSRDRLLRPPHLGVCAPAVPSACWPQWTTQKSVGLLSFIAGGTHPAAQLVSKIRVTIRVYGPPSPLDSSWQPQSSRIFRLGSGRPAIAVFTIDKMVLSTTDVPIESIDSSSPG